jgi:glycosyltransferase involved in cell wall biosynthesis
MAGADNRAARVDPPVGVHPVRRLRIGIYDHHWLTYGGGEQVDGSLAEVLSKAHDVTLLGPNPVSPVEMRNRLGPDISACGFEPVRTAEEATHASARFDLFINGAFLSRARNRAHVGWYYVMFPGAPRSGRHKRRQALARAAARLLGPVSGAPSRLNALRTLAAARCDDTADFARTYHRFLSDSRYTAHWVRELWQVPSDVLYPPVRPVVAPAPKSRTIVSIGRFFEPSQGHCKKQREMVDAFVGLQRSGRLTDWELILIGGCDGRNREYLLDLKRRARGYPVRFAVNAAGSVVTAALAQAALYWHAGGYGEDPVRHPERFEHFGIAVVEALAAGAVPLVFGAAGPAEIVRDGVDGFHWHSLDRLQDVTVDLASNPARRDQLAASAVTRAADFSADIFATNVRGLLAADFA